MAPKNENNMFDTAQSKITEAMDFAVTKLNDFNADEARANIQKKMADIREKISSTIDTISETSKRNVKFQEIWEEAESKMAEANEYLTTSSKEGREIDQMMTEKIQSNLQKIQERLLMFTESVIETGKAQCEDGKQAVQENVVTPGKVSFVEAKDVAERNIDAAKGKAVGVKNGAEGKLDEQIGDTKTIQERARGLTVGGLCNTEGIVAQATNHLSSIEPNDPNNLNLGDQIRNTTVRGLEATGNVLKLAEDTLIPNDEDMKVKETLATKVDEIQLQMQESTERGKQYAREAQYEVCKKWGNAMSNAETHVTEAKRFLASKLDNADAEKAKEISANLSEKLAAAQTDLTTAFEERMKIEKDEDTVGAQARRGAVVAVRCNSDVSYQC